MSIHTRSVGSAAPLVQRNQTRARILATRSDQPAGQAAKEANAPCPINQVDLPTRAINALRQGGIATLDEAGQWSDAALLSLPHFGRSYLHALRDLSAKQQSGPRPIATGAASSSRMGPQCPASPAKVTFAEAALSYLENHEGEARFLGCWDERSGKGTLLVGHFGGMPIDQISQTEIDQAAKGLYPNCMPASLKRQVYTPMSAVLYHAARNGWCASPKLRHPTPDPLSTKWSSPDRLAKLLPHCSPKIRRLVLFLTLTGAHTSEALRVVWETDVDINLRTVVLSSKSGKRRTVHIPDPLFSELATTPEPGRRGKLLGWQFRGSVYRPLREACRRAGIEYLTPHQQGRHTFAAWMRMYSGVDLAGLKAVGGWDSLLSVKRYAAFAPVEMASAGGHSPEKGKPSIPTSRVG